MTFKQFSGKLETIPASTSWYLADLSGVIAGVILPISAGLLFHSHVSYENKFVVSPSPPRILMKQGRRSGVGVGLPAKVERLPRSASLSVFESGAEKASLQTLRQRRLDVQMNDESQETSDLFTLEVASEAHIGYAEQISKML
jgi:hypothetical protein